MKYCLGTCLVLSALISSSFCLRAQQIVLSEGFSQPSALASWKLRTDTTATDLPLSTLSESGTVMFAGQRLESPTFSVDPLQYYRLDVKLSSSEKLLWGIVFYDADSTMLLADVYSSVDSSEVLRSETFYFQSKANARRAQLWLSARDEQSVTVDALSITSADTEAVKIWADSVYASIPSLAYTPAPDRLQLLPKTSEALQTGKKIRVVMLGNSIINDTGNSAWEVLVEDHYPGSNLEVITSVRGGTGCQYYQENNRVDTFVVQYQPDLLIIGGISHGHDTAAIHNVIRQVREKMEPAPEILVMSGPVGRQGDPQTNPEFTLPPQPSDFRSQLQAMTADAQVAYFDMKSVWGAYIKQSEKEYDYFLRDPVHANARGRQVLARILEVFFSPPQKGN